MRVDEVLSRQHPRAPRPFLFEMFPPKGELTLDTAPQGGRQSVQAFAELCLGHLFRWRLGQRCHHRPHRAYDYERIRYALGGAPHLCGPYPRRYRRQDR